MAKKMTAGQTIVKEIMSEGCEDCCGFCAVGQERLTAKIDRAIKRAVKAEREKIHKLASDLCGIKDQKLPKTWGKIVTPKKRRPSKP